MDEIIQPTSEPVVESKPVAEPTSTAKTILATALAAITLAGGGTYAMKQGEVNTLVEDKRVLTVEKQNVTDEYLYSQLTSGRLPDPGVASIDEINQAYANLIEKKGIVLQPGQDDLTIPIKENAESKGELLKCQ